MGRTLIIHDAVVARALAQLRRAATIDHAGRPFLAHLLGTWHILDAWRMPAHVCRAGFFHSVYSTSYYGKSLFGLDERERVRQLIGHAAEALVFRFCSLDRSDVWDVLAKRGRARTGRYRLRLRSGAPVYVGKAMLEKLLVIESANMAEQTRARDGGPAPWMSWLMAWWDFLEVDALPVRFQVRPRLTATADKHAVELYRRALGMSARKAMPLLNAAIDTNPWAGEPRLMSALCALDLGIDDPSCRAQEAADLLTRWAVPWDKRLTVSGWEALSHRVQAAAAHAASPRLSYRTICGVLSGRARKPCWLAV